MSRTQMTLINHQKISTRFAFLVLFFLAPVLCPLSSAHADIKVDITRGNVEPIPIAIPASTTDQTGNVAYSGSAISRRW